MIRWSLLALLAGCGDKEEESEACIWTAAVLDFGVTVVNGQTGDPVQGATLTCQGEEEPVATSDASGALSAQIDAKWGGSCGWSRCQSMVIDASDQGLAPVTVDAVDDADSEIVLQYLPD